MTTGAIQKGQRVLLVVYAPPSPAILESDSKAETAAKIVPGLGLVVKDAQDSHALKEAQDLQRYLPGWNAAAIFRSSFTLQLDQLGQPGKIISPTDTTIPAAAWYRLNGASDVNDWQAKYYTQVPGQSEITRNYSAFLELDDAVVLEINLLPSLATDDEVTYTPSLSAVTKLYRANTMRQLWRHETTVSDTGGRTLYDFKVKPGDLIYAWNHLMPQLGSQIADDLRKNLVAAGVPLSPKPSFAPASYTPGAAGYLPAGAGWAPAPFSPPGAPSAQAAPSSPSPAVVSASSGPFVPHASTP